MLYCKRDTSAWLWTMAHLYAEVGQLRGDVHQVQQQAHEGRGCCLWVKRVDDPHLAREEQDACGDSFGVSTPPPTKCSQWVCDVRPRYREAA